MYFNDRTADPTVAIPCSYLLPEESFIHARIAECEGREERKKLWWAERPTAVGFI